MKTQSYKKRLEEEKERLETRLASVGQRNPAVPNDWELGPTEDSQESDLADQAEILSHREENNAILKDLESRYDSVLGALDRIEKGAYGMCRVCGKKIEEARLDADPAAMTCKEHLNS